MVGSASTGDGAAAMLHELVDECRWRDKFEKVYEPAFTEFLKKSRTHGIDLQAISAVEYLRYEVNYLRDESSRLRRAGAMLSNCAYNLAQDESLNIRYRKSLDESRKAWDEAIALNGTHNAHLLLTPVVKQATAKSRR